MQVLYLTHDLNDAASWRRVAMLRMAGARVTIAGFHRGPVRAGDGATVIVPLGETANGAFAQRMKAVAGAMIHTRRKLCDIAPPDIILARNIETLALTPQVRRLFPSARTTVYECLDIHRLQLGAGLASRALRLAERALLKKADLVLTSSPAFVREYFQGIQKIDTPIRVVENKCLPGPSGARTASAVPTIGWFGILRCRQSLACLDAFTRASPGAFKVKLRGRPALDVVPEFHTMVEANPDLEFLGTYAPEDLPDIYGNVDFCWAIDRYEAGANSDWLLPNRLYEGCRYGAVPVALEGTEVARFLAAHDIGITLPKADALSLEHALSRADCAELRDAVDSLPHELWTTNAAECASLLHAMVTPGNASSDLSLKVTA